jgi:hypothetical protein
MGLQDAQWALPDESESERAHSAQASPPQEPLVLEPH